MEELLGWALDGKQADSREHGYCGVIFEFGGSFSRQGHDSEDDVVGDEREEAQGEILDAADEPQDLGAVNERRYAAGEDVEEEDLEVEGIEDGGWRAGLWLPRLMGGAVPVRRVENAMELCHDWRLELCHGWRLADLPSNFQYRIHVGVPWRLCTEVQLWRPAGQFEGL